MDFTPLSLTLFLSFFLCISHSVSLMLFLPLFLFLFLYLSFSLSVINHRSRNCRLGTHMYSKFTSVIVRSVKWLRVIIVNSILWKRGVEKVIDSCEILEIEGIKDADNRKNGSGKWESDLILEKRERSWERKREEKIRGKSREREREEKIKRKSRRERERDKSYSRTETNNS